MLILIRKDTLLCSAVFTLLFAFFSLVIFTGLGRFESVFAPYGSQSVTVVIDAGHGGEDGGAVASSGVKESHINLEIALRLNELLRFTGQRTVLTRSEDISICDEGLPTIRARKASDLKNRVELVNHTQNAVLLSIHQNSLPSSPKTHGAQVFWNKQPQADLLGNAVQDVLNLWINSENKKESKPIPDSIYLTKHAQAPSVVIECGFLSNADEANRLQDPIYQTKVASAIAAGYLHHMKGERDT